MRFEMLCERNSLSDHWLRTIFHVILFLRKRLILDFLRFVAGNPSVLFCARLGRDDCFGRFLCRTVRCVSGSLGEGWRRGLTNSNFLAATLSTSFFCAIANGGGRYAWS